jgi:hypothetical protein
MPVANARTSLPLAFPLPEAYIPRKAPKKSLLRMTKEQAYFLSTIFLVVELLPTFN